MYGNWLLTVVLASVATAWTDTAQCGSATTDPLATFQKLDAYISANPLEFETSFSSGSPALDTELSRGTAQINAIQPKQLRMDATTSKGSFLVVSDGTKITMLNKKNNRYAQAPSPPTYGNMVVLFTGMISMEPHTLLFLQTVKTVANGESKVTAAPSGAETVGGRTCNKFSIAASDGAVWEAWLSDADIPLPCKLISRDRDDPNAAVQTNVYKWASDPAPADPDLFTFTPPQDSKHVNFGDLLN